MRSEQGFDDRVNDRSPASSEVAIAVGLLGILFIILVPLRPGLMDALLIANITASLLILLTTACVHHPLELSVFPSLLLVVTFFRLALNIGTTRLILGNAGEEKLAAAGGVIQAFATIVAGNDLIVGMIVFIIIMVVQFVVITKGTTRISEVTARFTLDAMPGKQLSIDSELSAGLIDEHTARELRNDINQEADFYGAMDGASKFVRGEAVAGLVITLVNIGAGFFIGVFNHRMAVGHAADVFARLTIGDGLVSQIPALMVSVATALIVTKNAGGDNLARDLGRQLLSNERILFLLAAFLILLLPSGLPKLALIFGAVICGYLGWHLRQRGGEDESFVEEELAADPELERPPESPEVVRSLLVLEPIELELGFRLVGLVDQDRGGDLLDRLSKVRQKVALELGFVMPFIKVRDNIRVRPTEYSIRLRGNSLGCWRVYPDRLFALPGKESSGELDGKPGTDPITGAPGLWIGENDCPLAASAGCSVRSVPELLVDHLHDLVRSHAAEILTREEVARLVSDLRARSPVLVDELIPAAMKLGDLHKVLQALLREQVSVRDLETILEVLADFAGQTSPVQLGEEVRRRLARGICDSLSGSGRKISALFLTPALEEFLQGSLQCSKGDPTLAIEPEVADTLIDNITKEILCFAEAEPPVVLVCSGSIRAQLRQLLASKMPRVAALAYEELIDEFELEARGTVALKKVG